jgi:hypothetical protein
MRDLKTLAELEDKVDIPEERDAGWTIGHDGHPYTFEHIDEVPEPSLYRVETVVPLVDNAHRNVHFLSPEEKENFFGKGYSDFSEYVVSINRVTIPEAHYELCEKNFALDE